MLALALLSVLISLILFQTVISIEYVKVENILGIEAILSLSVKAYLLLFKFVMIILAGYVVSFLTMKTMILIKSGAVRFFKNYLFKNKDVE